MKITPHFMREEFDCHDGTQYPERWIDPRLIRLCRALEFVRQEVGNKPIVITSGYRTESYNVRVGGANNSQHKNGIAADFFIPGVPQSVAYSAVQRLIFLGVIEEGGLARYRQGFIHYDQRGTMARWNGRFYQEHFVSDGFAYKGGGLWIPKQSTTNPIGSSSESTPDAKPV